MRTAGILLVIGCCLELLSWEIERRWGWTPSPVAITDAAMQAVLGAGLIRAGRIWALPTLVFIATAAVFSCIRSAVTSAPLFDDPQRIFLVIDVSIPFVLGLLRISPFLLLLAAKQTTRRYGIAIALFVFQEIVDLGMVGVSIYVSEWIRHR